MNFAVVEPTPEEWDRFVVQHPQGNLLQRSPWGELKTSSGWSVRRIAILGIPQTNSTTQEVRQVSLLAGAQMLFRTRYMVSVAYIPRGPLFSGISEVDNLLLAAMQHVARQKRAIFLRLEPNILEQDPQADRIHTWLLLKGYHTTETIQPRSTIHLTFTATTIETLFAHMSKGHRADIRRAERQGVTIQTGTISDIDTFYGIMQSTSQRANFGIHTRAYYEQAMRLFGENSLLLIAQKDAQAIASHLVFHDTHAGFYLYSGATQPGLKVGANHLLQWHALQWAHQHGCTHYDFWGIPDTLGRAALLAEEHQQQKAALEHEAEQDPLIGVYRFKKGFGGTIVRYLPAYDYIYFLPFYTLWQRRLQ